jgi:hypothetical protein
MFAALNSFLTRAVTGYFLNKSLRFRSSASAYLNRTPATTTNQKTWTWSGWVKRGILGSSTQELFIGTSSGNFTGVRILADQLYVQDYLNGSYNIFWATTAVYRDPAAWYHVVVSYDTTQASSTNAVSIWINGVIQAVSFSTALGGYVQNRNGYINTASTAHYVSNGASPNYFDGEMTAINFIDGQALAPTAFGASSIYNQWLPIAYAGTYGTNGFYLPFTNTTSTSTLVADSSGNGNNWTPNNISLTAGSTYDSLTDVPTLTSTTVANYAVLNPLDKGVTVTMSNGNLKMVQSGVGTDCFRASMALPATGKWYWEIKVTAIGSGGNLGVATQSSSLAAGGSLTGILSQYSGYYAVNGWSNSGSYTAWTTGDLIAVAVDSGTGIVTFYKNGSSLGAIPTALTASQTYFPFGQSTNSTYDFNFGQQPFVYTAPSGFLPLNTFNI